MSLFILVFGRSWCKTEGIKSIRFKGPVREDKIKTRLHLSSLWMSVELL